MTTAGRLVGQDDEVACGSLHDAARKITAHVLAHGLRATNRAGAHEVVGRYAAAAITDTGGSVARSDRVRRRRNRSEDDDPVLVDRDVEVDLDHATAVVAAVSAALVRS